MPQGSSTFQPVIRDNEIADRVLLMARAKYKFADDGGVAGTINLFGSALIPSGAVVVEAGLDVITIAASGGAATIAVQLEAAGDLLAAAAFNGAPWSTTGRKNLIPQTWATSVKTTAARDLAVVIAAANLTAGEWDVYVKYLIPV